MTAVNQEAVFIGANKQAHSSDYNPDYEIAAFGASTTVALWKPFTSSGVYSTLKSHTKEVTGVKFIPNSKFLVSSAEDGKIVVWSAVSDSAREEITFTEHQTLDFHEGSVTALATAPGVIVTGGVDGNVAIWKIAAEESKWSLYKSFQVKRGFYPTCFALQEVFGEYLVAVGGTTADVYLYTVEGSDSQAPITLKGHEDWMKTLAWTEDTETEGAGWMLATGSQDRYIRLWRVRKEVPKSEEDANKLVLLANKKEILPLQGTDSRLEVYFEALIMGHDDWVTGLVWNDKKQLLSSSADTGLMIWEMDPLSGIWVCISRLGEMSIKGASTATGSSGGFWSCLWINKGDKEYILANGKTGSFRVYQAVTTTNTTGGDDESGVTTTGESSKAWTSILGITGPTKEVTDFVWSPNGEFFYSTSIDQTTRLFSYAPELKSWREFARPQIHGYDMSCIANITDTKFVSGGDEKVLRVFEMTNNTAELLVKNGVNLTEGETSVLPVTASLPVLGLSNKADNEATVKEGIVGEMNTKQDAEEEDEDEADVTEKAKADEQDGLPPLEDSLQRVTLFPEIEKLYGHGYELTCCCTTSGFIASACRSNTARHAVIRVFDTKDYQMVHVLEGHNLTITSMEFSPNGKYLIAVSRDRQLSLWDVEAGLTQISLKQAHSRIIWDCAWLDNKHFITGSRDKSIKLWTIDEGGKDFNLLFTQKFEVPVTSVASISHNSKYYIAIGMEEGIQVYTTDLNGSTLSEFVKFDASITPGNKVSKLAWGKSREGRLTLGVGSSDSSVRLYLIDP